ncbi:hypothetical protein RN001_013980 [Aquatica leii]|uniref:Uncharacterized protein n=1 Tax=Aquatica leii TaxID=1421715 RepID=A0AAN7SNY0_9COLE|nr:hypothetical protein RN001_013980 [Aquatica leii]
MWSNILVRCNETSKSLQSVSLPLDLALKLADFLTAFVKDQRDKFEMYETTSKQIYPDFKYKTNTTRSRQRSSRLTFFDGATEDTQFQGREKFRTEVYIPIIDTLIAQLQQRSKAYDQLLNLFGFFSRLSVLRTEELEIHCQTFTEFM